jgi:hypothetical protein
MASDEIARPGQRCVSITKGVYNMALDEFFGWYGQEPRPGFTKATVNAWRVTLDERELGSSSIIVRISAAAFAGGSGSRSAGPAKPKHQSAKLPGGGRGFGEHQIEFV